VKNPRVVFFSDTVNKSFAFVRPRKSAIALELLLFFLRKGSKKGYSTFNIIAK
jgi:hypothetical protein